jgi:pantoate--beta-alanine ligase
MASRLPVLRTIPQLRRAVTSFHKDGGKIALVPTMGALHAGHLSLVRFARRSLRRSLRRVIVSIFVNPAQFAPHEDFASYPRSFAADVAALKQTGADMIWAPSVEAMYPDGFATHIALEGAAKVGLEDAFRPHFFGGVATVVAKLFIQCQPDVAVFGQKDYQQLKVITRMASDLDLPVRVIGAPTVRETDGLAMSSRNAYLSPAERAIAPTLFEVLNDSARAIAAGQSIARTLAKGRATIERAGFALDYLEARHAETLVPVRSKADGPLRLLVAARIGRTRLIDNIAVPD